MQIEIPRNAGRILKRLNEAGYEAYVVGGCVRDVILGRVPGDWDITTSAAPEQVKALFHSTIDTGIRHGTVTVLVEGETYEVTTYRIDGEYEDGRHPKQVEFTSLLSEDLRRRDFTINAMAYHPEEGLVDLYEGIRDLQERRIRCVGCAEERFGEDALRILRALRFAAQLDFDIEEETMRAIRKMAPTLTKISAERIQKEMTLLLTGRKCSRVRDAWRSGVTAVILPELDRMMETGQNNPHHCYTVGEHCLHALEYAREQFGREPYWVLGKKEQIVMQWTILLHDVAKPLVMTSDDKGIDHFYGHCEKSAEIAREILLRLKFDHYTVDTVTKLIRLHDRRANSTEKAMRHTMNVVGSELPLLFCVMEADVAAQNPALQEKKVQFLAEQRSLYEKVLAAGDATTVKHLALTGRDLISLGVPQGKEVGVVLQDLLEQVLDEPSRNTKEWLSDYVRTKFPTEGR